MSPLFLLLGLPVGYVYGALVEYLGHKYLFHVLGRRRGSPLAFHWNEHHRHVRQQGGADLDYTRPFWEWNAHSRELFGLVVLGILHLPVLFVWPTVYIAGMAHGYNYHRLHKKAHLDPEWCRKHLRWHWDHHMALNQDANWCVTNEWLDKLLGTRVLSEDRPARVRKEANAG